MNIICQFCCSRNFVAERRSYGKFTSCCRKGKLKLPRPMDVNGVEQAYADFLRNLLTSSAQFREHIWRLLESKMHDRSHAVMRLPVHLPNQQRIIFEEGNEEEALLAARTGRTKLESWFLLNINDASAREYLYTDIPLHYVYVRNNLQKRQRVENEIVARMYTVSVKDEERFYLRLLLLHVPGATSFESLRTLNGAV